MYNTRIAPSPTGDLHIGTIRTAYFNWLAARSTKGRFILRIDDTDLARSKPEYVHNILETLDWLGLDHDELVYQSSRFPIYQRAALDLVGRGLAIHKDGSVALDLGDYVSPPFWTDQINGQIAVTARDREATNGMVLIKSDGSPSYNWSSVIDDRDLGITYIIRGTDHITNTSRQIILWDLLGATPPALAHVGLICSNKKPLSKRDGAASVTRYMRAGYDRDAMLSFLARLGWGPTKDDKSVSMPTRAQMLELFFAGGKMNSRPAGMDLAKLESFDRKYKAQRGVWRTGEALLTS